MKTMDYKEIESELLSIANKFQQANKRFTKHPFKGKNFMTDKVIAIRQFKNGIWFELSYGTWINRSYLFGITFSDTNGNTLPESICCSELKGIEEVLTKMREYRINK